MKKTRMSIDDIHAMVGSIRKNVLNMRVTNIYDLPSGGGGLSKTYIFKLHQPPYPKVFLLLESGVRFHTSKYARDASSASASLPSQFTMKLRKHLRGKRLVALTQLEGDRVVDLTFGADQLQCHLILELYASGNIILTDENYTILSLLRTHKFDEHVTMAVKQVYPIGVLEKKDASDAIQTPAQLCSVLSAWFDVLDARTAGASGKAAKKKVQTLKQLLLLKETSFGGLGPVIVEHCIVSAGLAPSFKIKSAAEFAAIGDTALTALVSELQNGWRMLEKLQTEQNAAVVDVDENGAPLAVPTAPDAAAKPKCGFIVLKDRSDASAPEQYEEFTPLLYAQHKDKRVQSFDTFDEAVDEYFSRFEAEVAEVAKHTAQLAAESKLAKLRKNQKTQIDQLLDVQAKSFRHAQLLEANQQDVENVLLVVRSALASGMDWRGLEELVRFEQKNGNPVACLIHELDLANNRVSILLCDSDDDDDEEDEDPAQQDKQAHVIWIDLSLSALANAREIYTKKKKAGEKVVKATEATQKAIQAAEKSTQKTLAKQQTKRHAIYERRKVLWFEKFHWFLTNEHYLVIAGKDAHQNELLVKRYLRKGDVYVHADLHGAATCIVRNRAAVAGAGMIPPIPVGTLEQAGCMSVCRSNAWTNQVIAGAYWVHADQVSKTAPAGEYLTTGSFMIRGKKNYIQPSRLEMGLAILFRLDESSVANHRSEADEPLPTLDAAGLDEAAEEEAAEEEEAEEVSASATGESDEPQTEEAALEKPKQEDQEQEEEAPAEASAAAPEVTEDDEDADAAEASATAAPERPGKKRISAKERRDLKKGKVPGAASSNSAEDESPSTSSKSNAPPQSNKSKASEKNKSGSKAAIAEAAAKNVRGKKGKLKKLKKKYADQDDDERRLRMEALGHVVAVDDDENDKDDENDDDDDASSAATAAASRPKTGNAVGAVDDEYIRQVREKKEKFLEEQEEEAEGADFFDTFTGAPLPHDLVLYAVPMCAPYASLQKYKYKVKLLPGAQKKGKAAKQAMEYFFQSIVKFEKDVAKQHAARATTQDEDAATPDVDPLVVQRELMKCIPENELVNCMVGPVKISAPGLHGSTGSKKGGGGGKKSKQKK